MVISREKPDGSDSDSDGSISSRESSVEIILPASRNTQPSTCPSQQTETANHHKTNSQLPQLSSDKDDENIYASGWIKRRMGEYDRIMSMLTSKESFVWGFVSESRIPRRRGYQTWGKGKGCQHTILPYFSKNCMNLRKFGVIVSTHQGHTLDPPRLSFLLLF